MPFPLEYKFIMATEDRLGFKFLKKYKAKCKLITVLKSTLLFPTQSTNMMRTLLKRGADFHFKTLVISKIKWTMDHLSAKHQSTREIGNFSMRTALPSYIKALATIYYYKMNMASI